MIRGVFSIAGLGILLVLLVRAALGQVSLTDVAIRGLVIVVCIAVVDKVIVPLIAAGLRATAVEIDDAEKSAS